MPGAALARRPPTTAGGPAGGRAAGRAGGAAMRRDDVHIEIQLAYARRELALCQDAERDQPTLSRGAYAVMMTVKEAILRTLERVADEARLP